MTTLRPVIFRILTATVLSASVFLPGCGAKEDLVDVSTSLQTRSTTDSSTQQLLATLPKIMEGLEDIKTKIDALELRSADDDLPVPVTTKPRATTVSGTTKPSTTAGTTTTKPTTTTTSKPATTTTKPATPQLSAKEKGAQELKKLLAKVSSAPFIQASVEKVEKNLKTGKVTTNKLTMYTKQPNQVKIEVSFSSSGATGAKVLYSSGEGDKVKIRPGGNLSFITTELDKKDERIVSNNGYPLDDTDFFGVARRMSSGYDAELIGATTLNGKKIHILKLTTSGTNSVDSRITHEHIGYDPTTYGIVLWEIFNDAASKEPFFRLTLPSLEFPASIDASRFKV
jgi:uncharacterized membrane protein